MMKILRIIRDTLAHCLCIDSGENGAKVSNRPATPDGIQGVVLFDLSPLQPEQHANNSSVSLERAREMVTASNADVFNDLPTVERTIELYRSAVDMPSTHPDYSALLTILANALVDKYRLTGSSNIMDEAVIHFRNAIAAHAADDTSRMLSVIHFAKAMLTKFSITVELKDLDEAISLFREGLTMCPPGNNGNAVDILTELAMALISHYESTGAIADAEEAISLYRRALALYPPGTADRFASLNNLGTVLCVLYEQTNKVDYLDEAILHLREAFDLDLSANPGHMVTRYFSLANALITRYEQTHNIDDLEEAISKYRGAVASLSNGINRPRYLSSLGNALLQRFNETGREEDIQEAIAVHNDALASLSPDDPDRPGVFGNLSTALLTRFQTAGRTQDLEQGISLCRESLRSRTPTDPAQSNSSNNLACALLLRFYLTESRIEDLEEAISHFRDTLDLRPPGNIERPGTLSNIGAALLRVFKSSGELKALEEAIEVLQEASNLYPTESVSYGGCLSTISEALYARSVREGSAKDLQDAISFARQALSLDASRMRIYRASLFENLGDYLLGLFAKTEAIQDLDEAITNFREALALRPPGHPERSTSLTYLGGALLFRFEQTEETANFEESIQLLQSAATHEFSSSRDRFASAVLWASYAKSHRHPSCLQAYTMALHLLERCLVVSPTVEVQHRFLTMRVRDARSVALDAAAYAIEVGQLETAVEILEQGRAMIWSQMRGFRTPIGRLQDANPSLAEKFMDISVALENLALSSQTRNAISLSFTDSERTAQSREVEYDMQMSKKRALTQEWDSLVAQIRRIKGLEQFLQSTPFNVLKTAASKGPVIVVNHSSYRSDALIILHNAPLILVSLADEFYEQVSLAYSDIPEDVRRPAPYPSSRLSLDEEESEDEMDVGSLERLLPLLWRFLGHPVVEQLRSVGIKEQSRIWWCLTSILTAMPIHAAGPTESSHDNYLCDIYVSSYTPTLTSLIMSRAGSASANNASVAAAAMKPKLLAIQGPHLQNAEREVRQIVDQIGDSSNAIALGRQEAIRETVMQLLPNYTWIHFACHGFLSKGRPFDSYFGLWKDTRLTLLDIMKARLSNAEHAFLSACDSAAAEREDDGSSRTTPDEVLHMAAAVQFCGFRSVVGTLWPMMDSDGPAVAKAFYEHMLLGKDSEGFMSQRYERSARALYEATKKMREQQKMSLERWVTFVHIGA